jgi:hypothetical protein
VSAAKLSGSEAIWPTSKFTVGAITLKKNLDAELFKNPIAPKDFSSFPKKAEVPATSKEKPCVM